MAFEAFLGLDAADGFGPFPCYENPRKVSPVQCICRKAISLAPGFSLLRKIKEAVSGKSGEYCVSVMSLIIKLLNSIQVHSSSSKFFAGGA